VADGLVEDQTAVAGDGDDGAGELAGLDLGVQRGDDRNRCGGITYKFCARVEMMSSVAD
jgi:hypothetical protein